MSEPNAKKPKAQPGGEPRNKDGRVFVTQYVNRWGKLMIAKDYGYQCWCLLSDKH